MHKSQSSEYTLEAQYDSIEDVASEERLKILFGGSIPSDEEWSGGIIRFSNSPLSPYPPVHPSIIRRLDREGYLSLEQQFNNSPTIGQMVTGAEAVNSVSPPDGICRMIGYAVSPERFDCRITVEGAIYQGPVTDSVRDTFTDQFGTGYEFSESDTHLRRWHD